jgi:hypothetical protein
MIVEIVVVPMKLRVNRFHAAYGRDWRNPNGYGMLVGFCHHLLAVVHMLTWSK